jgi:hypothetical protein
MLSLRHFRAAAAQIIGDGAMSWALEVVGLALDAGAELAGEAGPSIDYVPSG